MVEHVLGFTTAFSGVKREEKSIYSVFRTHSPLRREKSLIFANRQI
jgi:hypothetical protein